MPFDRARALRLAAAALLIWLAAAPCALAHNPDTSYVRVQLSDEWIETQFTFDIDVLEKVARLDPDGDGNVTRAEFDAAVPAVRDFLRKSVEFEINESPADLGEFGEAKWPDRLDAVPAPDRGVTLVGFPFRKRVQELPESVTLVFHTFGALGDRHTVLGTFAEPGRPEYEALFTWDEPDFLYFTDIEPPPEGAGQFLCEGWDHLFGGAASPRWSRMLGFLRLGMEHIFFGYDHIAFLLALIVVDKFSTLLKIITSFTVAHTITLILATLEVVSLPSRLIESAIAVTIMYVALENLWGGKTSHRWVLTFFFGLVHGFGFANVLREMDLPTSGLVRCLVSFNVGVELGQVMIVAAIWPAWRLLSRGKHGKTLAKVLSAVIFLFGAAWFTDRVFALGFMPF